MTKRYELKYNLENSNLSRVLDIIRFHPAAFQVAFPDRVINNYYLDTDDLQFFYQNVNGINKRRKFRIRWYDELSDNSKAILEIKNKENELGWKEHFQIPSSKLNNKTQLMQEIFGLGIAPFNISPSLYNQYKRSYFVSADNRFRITIDREQKFARPYLLDKVHGPIIEYSDVVLELKFDKEYMSISDEITQYLPFLRTKNSKYSTGIISLNQS